MVKFAFKLLNLKNKTKTKNKLLDLKTKIKTKNS